MASHKTSGSRIFWGFLLIVLGVLFLLDRMERLDFGDLFSQFWPLILIFWGVWYIVASRFRNLVGGLILIILGAVFQLAELDILEDSVWNYIWPVLIILLGIWVLSGLFRKRTAGGWPGVKDDELDAFAMLSGFDRRVESQNFRGGKATAILGGIDLDFTPARLAGGKATVELTAIMGGIDVRVPKSMRVELEAHPLLGGVEDKHAFAPGSESAPTLYIKASAILGGIEIKD
ncbi:MAG: DUF5668 domain-containing protein [Acidobacteriota bacterium]